MIDAVSLLYDKYYDYKFQLDTYNWVSQEELIKEDDVANNASSYQATKVLPLRVLFKKMQLSKDKVLVDIGSGKGRVLLVASEFGVKHLRGIEFSANLCRIARKNIEGYCKRTNTKSNFEIIQCDASLYELRDDEDIFFLYNPFNHVILNKVLENISRSVKRRPRPLQIVYAYPVNRAHIESFFKIKSVQDYDIWKLPFTVYDI